MYVFSVDLEVGTVKINLAALLEGNACYLVWVWFLVHFILFQIANVRLWRIEDICIEVTHPNCECIELFRIDSCLFLQFIFNKILYTVYWQLLYFRQKNISERLVFMLMWNILIQHTWSVHVEQMHQMEFCALYLDKMLLVSLSLSLHTQT